MTDKELRPLIRSQLAKQHAGSVVIDEMSLMREKRADLTIVNQSLWGYEIKSDHDNLDRLPEQVPFYDAVFDYCTVIAAPRFLDRITNVIGPHWGVASIQASGQIKELRPPSKNAGIRLDAICQLLWKPEAVRLLRLHGNRIPAKSCVTKIWDALKEVPPDSLCQCIRESLISRKVLEGRVQL